MDLPFEHVTIERSNRRTVSLHILPSGEIVVKAPRFTPDRFIHQFIQNHEEWIRKKLLVVEKRPSVGKKQFVEGEEFLYLGVSHILTIGSYTTIHLKENTLYFPRAMKFRIKKELSSWYINKAKEIITERVKFNAREMNVGYKELYFSDTKSKWGSCSHDNKLQFNWRLIMAPLTVLNYVVIHELAHTVEKNHSDDFWSLVGKYTPSYKQHRKWLKTNGDTLVL